MATRERKGSGVENISRKDVEKGRVSIAKEVKGEKRTHRRIYP